MTIDLRDHPFFELWVDPQSGIESFVLTERVAPVQQSFYFTNVGISPDEKWMWFYAAFPPATYRTLGAVGLDPTDPQILHFPSAQFSSVSPMVAPESDSAYFCLGRSVWRQPLVGEPEVICALDGEFVNRRAFGPLATHLTMSADGKYFLLDGAVGGHWFVGLGDRESGEVRILKELARNYNHAQFSTTDPELFLIAQDWWHDHVSGQYFDYDHRIWLMDVGQTRFEPLCPTDWYRHGSAATHEWWSADGLICWVDYREGVFEYDLERRQACKVWQGPLCHAHCDPSRQYWCADQSPYTWKEKPCEVRFYDRAAGREINIVTALPLPPYGYGQYHLDPHPQFSPKGTWVIYTTTVQGKVDVALTPVQGILEALEA